MPKRVLHGSALLLLSAAVASCGTSSGNQALALAGDVVSAGISGAGAPDKPTAWSMKEARCGLFRDHRMACPVLRNCSALFGTAEPLTVNVCVDDMGDLEPVKWSNYGRSWCRASGFPGCQTAKRWSCTDFEIVVCEEENQTQRILRSQVDPKSGQCAYELATRYEQAPAP